MNMYSRITRKWFTCSHIHLQPRRRHSHRRAPSKLQLLMVFDFSDQIHAMRRGARHTTKPTHISKHMSKQWWHTTMPQMSENAAAVTRLRIVDPSTLALDTPMAEAYTVWQKQQTRWNFIAEQNRKRKKLQKVLAKDHVHGPMFPAMHRMPRLYGCMRTCDWACV